MLFAGVLAVRKVSEMESSVALHVSRFNFRVTARIQVGWTRLSFRLACLRIRPISAATYRAQYAGHHSFCTEPPSQEWPPARKSSSRVDYLSCVRLDSDASLSDVIDLCPVLSALLPFFLRAPRTAEGRLLTYFLSFCPCFVLLSIRAEGLFYLSYCTTLYLWTRVEEAVRPETPKHPAQTNGGEYGSRWNPRGLSLGDVRIALFFLFFVQVGFFGTGK